MRKSLLLMGLFGSLAATAQQNDVFDIDAHLKKKWEDEKTKLSLLSPLTNNSVSQPQPSYLLQQFQSADPGALLLNGKDGVYLLPVDNMPCFKPDMSQFKQMPNVANQHSLSFNFSPAPPVNGQMPNASGKFKKVQ